MVIAGVTEWTSADWVAVMGAAGAFVGACTGAFLKLLAEFRKSAVKVEELHVLANNQLDTMRDERDSAREDVAILKRDVEDLVNEPDKHEPGSVDPGERYKRAVDDGGPPV
jgi:hypothetical protein